MTRAVRLGLALAIVTALAAQSVEACSRHPRPTDTQLFSEAKEVFVARVISTELKRMPRKECDAEEIDEDECAYVQAWYERVDVLKGSPPRRGNVRDLVFGPGNCSLGLLAGFYYVFYLGSDYNWVPHINGSFPLGPLYEERERKAVQRIKEHPHQRPDEGT